MSQELKLLKKTLLRWGEDLLQMIDQHDDISNIDSKIEITYVRKDYIKLLVIGAQISIPIAAVRLKERNVMSNEIIRVNKTNVDNWSVEVKSYWKADML